MQAQRIWSIGIQPPGELMPGEEVSLSGAAFRKVKSEGAAAGCEDHKDLYVKQSSRRGGTRAERSRAAEEACAQPRELLFFFVAAWFAFLRSLVLLRVSCFGILLEV